ncbi:helix-turn-helix domain-containing protein [Methylobacterium sp. NEAU 140]|uniref:IclR family transcriptional regulator n=1 Tax=Methylobacterium sp. NEAU 140 TaxID=3064945 RepID=UPI00273266DF|nr:helix-turn-helix domain-containing protein [Methylobacterium sp. NEAU 140]MDP4021482.1 helix-turn-helix domain-containing protein [Methylobacterium sp. NEAU 140]
MGTTAHPAPGPDSAADGPALPDRRRGAGAGLSVGDDAGRGATCPVKSAARVLQVLELFDEIQREARVGEIAGRLGVPQSSTSVLLKSLTQLGYLDYDPESRSYLPSPRVALLGTWLDKGPVRDGSLVRMLEDLSERTGGTVILAARNAIYSQYLHVLQARTAMRFHVPPGTRRLVVWSATGTALLGGIPDGEIGSLVRRTNAEAPRDRAPVAAAAVIANVARLRRDGHFFSRGLVTAGAGSIAVPLPSCIDRRGRPLAVAVSGLLDAFERREAEIVAAIHDAIGRFLAPEA